MTLLGRHTVSETFDYLKILDARVEEDNVAYKKIPAAWRATNPTKASDLDRDWAACYRKWKDLAFKVGTSLKILNAATPLVSPQNIPSEDEWQKLIAFWDAGKEPGGLRDCEYRISEANNQPIDHTKVTITNAPDTDLDVLKEVDKQIRDMEAAAAAAKKKAGEAAKSNMGIIVIGGLVVLGGVVVATKVYL